MCQVLQRDQGRRHVYKVQEALSGPGRLAYPCLLHLQVMRWGSRRRRCRRSCRHRHWYAPNNAVKGLPVGPRRRC